MSPGTPPDALLLIGAAVAWCASAGATWLLVAKRPTSDRLLYVSLASLAALAAFVAVAAGPRHDYLAFLEEWNAVVAGLDPWDESLVGSRNAYGPLFAALAPLTTVYDLLPKLVFVAAWVAVAAWFVRLYLSRADLSRLAPLIVAYFALMPYFWVEIALYGHFDVLPAAATLLGLHLVVRGYARAAGASLAVGGLLKLAPLLALPFLAAARRGAAARVTLAGAAVFGGGMALAAAIWGSSVLEPLRFAAERESRLLSIFQFLRGEYSPLLLFADDPDVDGLSIVALAAVLGALLVYTVVRRPHPAAVLTAAFVALFALYTVGNPQFQMVVFVLVPYLYATLPEETRNDRVMIATIAAYLAWFSVFDVVYVVGGMLTEGRWLAVRELAGLPTFLLAIAAFVGLARAFDAEVREPGRPLPLPAVGRARRSLGTAEASDAR